MGLCMTMLSDRDDPFMLMRSMMLTEFRCPPLPMVGQLAEDGSSAVINSHDLMATFVAEAFRHSDETKNSVRRQIQTALRDRYMRALAEDTGPFEKTYSIMARHTREYLATYLLGTPFSVHDLHVLPSDRITARLAKEIDHYTRALRIVVAAAGMEPVPQEEEAASASPGAPAAVDYGSHDVVQVLLVRCARCAVQYEKEGVVDEPVLKRMRNGVDAE